MGLTNITTFNIAVGKFVDENPGQFKLIRDKLAFQALAGVVLKTPVDTGRARGNWQVATGDPATGDLDVEDVVGSSAIANGNGQIALTKPFDIIWISNNLPYIEVLEEGSSRQAPNGMLGITFEELVTQFS